MKMRVALIKISNDNYFNKILQLYNLKVKKDSLVN